MFCLARLDVERTAVVPRLAVLLRELVALALLRADMDDDGRLRVLHRGERSDERLGVVAVRDIAVREPHRAEEIVRGSPVRLAQFLERAVHAAVVLRDGLVVVVEHDDEVRIHGARRVEPLERFAARHRAVADERDDVFLPPREIARLGKPRCETDRCRRVPHVEEVVRTLLGIRIARDIVVVRLVDVGRGAPRQHLMRIGLMRDVVDDLVPRRVKDRVERDDRLDRAEVWAEMPAVYARALQHRVAHLLCQRPALCGVKALDIRGRRDFFQIQRNSPFSIVRRDSCRAPYTPVSILTAL